MDILEKLDKEITQQTRNGRTDVYVEVQVLEKLAGKKAKGDYKNAERVYIDLYDLNDLINIFKNKNKQEEQER